MVTHSNNTSLSIVAVVSNPVGVAGDPVAGGDAAVVKEGLHCHHYVNTVFEVWVSSPTLVLKPRRLLDRTRMLLVSIASKRPAAGGREVAGSRTRVRGGSVMVGREWVGQGVSGSQTGWLVSYAPAWLLRHV